jgi:hypothetical protein
MAAACSLAGEERDMPYEKDVQERKYWWCPKWYWPFAICSGIRTQHKWCYNFSWVKETRYGFVGHLEGCEDGKLYTWTEAILGLGSTTYPAGEMCFNSSRGADEGRCDPSNTGLMASGLSASAPYASAIDWDVTDLESTTAETGEFDFSGEHASLCRQGVWPWRQTLHRQMVEASVATRFASVQWFVGGMPLTGASGTVAMATECRWPFPLPGGRTQYRAVVLDFSVTTEANKSTLQLRNRPADGGFSVPVSMSASDGGNIFSTTATVAAFEGETCDFEGEEVSNFFNCLSLFLKKRIQRVKPGLPNPLDPIAVLPHDILRAVPRDRRERVATLLDAIAESSTGQPEGPSAAVMQLERETRIPGIARFLPVRSGLAPEAVASAGACAACGTVRSVALVVIALAAGALAGAMLL